jgi:anti-anti-sigma factor
MIESETKTGSPFAIERRAGTLPGTEIFCFSGAFTAREMLASLSPNDLREMLYPASTPGGAAPELQIFDLAGVPYLDSSGLGMIARHCVHCQNQGVRFVIAGASPRVRELFRVTRMDTVIPLASTTEQAENL